MGEFIFEPETVSLSEEFWGEIKKGKQTRMLPSAAAETLFVFGGGVVGCDSRGELFWGGLDGQKGAVIDVLWRHVQRHGRITALDASDGDIVLLQRDESKLLWLSFLSVGKEKVSAFPTLMNDGLQVERFRAKRCSIPVSSKAVDVFMPPDGDQEEQKRNSLGATVVLVFEGERMAAVTYAQVRDFVEVNSAAIREALSGSQGITNLPYWEGSITFNGLD